MGTVESDYVKERRRMEETKENLAMRVEIQELKLRLDELEKKETLSGPPVKSKAGS